jgi:hypothetical protein
MDRNEQVIWNKIKSELSRHGDQINLRRLFNEHDLSNECFDDAVNNQRET